MDFEAKKEQVYSHYSRRVDRLLRDFREEKEAQVCSLCDDRKDCPRTFHHLKTLIGLLLRQGVKDCGKREDVDGTFDCFEAPFYALDNILAIFPYDGPQKVLYGHSARLAKRFAKRWGKKKGEASEG